MNIAKYLIGCPAASSTRGNEEDLDILKRHEQQKRVAPLGVVPEEGIQLV